MVFFTLNGLTTVRNSSVLRVVNCILGACPGMTNSRHALSCFLRVCAHQYEHCSGIRSLTFRVFWACGLPPLLLLVLRRSSFSFSPVLSWFLCSRSFRLRVWVLRQRESLLASISFTSRIRLRHCTIIKQDGNVMLLPLVIDEMGTTAKYFEKHLKIKDGINIFSQNILQDDVNLQNFNILLKNKY